MRYPAPMALQRVLIAGVALALTGAMAFIAMRGSGSSTGELGPTRDPAASGRGAALLNPYCRNVPAADFERPPNIAYSGRFDNPTYGYAVTIPAGLTGYAAPEQPSQGFGIVLSWEPRVYLRVAAAYDVFYDITAQAVHQRDALAVRLHDTLLADSTAADMLGEESAVRYRMRYRCPRDPQIYLREALLVMRNREIYRLELQTTPSRYENDVQVLAALQRSWRWIPVRVRESTPRAPGRTQ